MFERLAGVVQRRPFLILGCWLLVIALCVPFALRVTDVLIIDPELPPGSVADDVRNVLAVNFEQQADFQVVLIAEGTETGVGPGDPPFDEEFGRVLAAIEALPDVQGVIDPGGVHDLPFDLDAFQEAYAVALVILASDEGPAKRRALDRIESIVPEGGGLHVHLTGRAVVERELIRAGERDARRAEAYGLPLSLVILVVAFGAVVAAGLPLFMAVFAIVTSLAVIFALGHVYPTAVYVQTVVSMLGLTTGINYSLVMVHRFREELTEGRDARIAAANATRTAGRSIALSGFTVCIALCALLVPPLTFIRSIGFGGLIVMAISVSLALTALPALLAVLGHRVNALKVTRRKPGERTRTFWRLHAGRVLRRPRLWLALGIPFLVVLTAPAFGMQLSSLRVHGFAGGTTSAEAQALLTDVGLADVMRSFDVVLDFGERTFFHPSSVRQVSRFERASAGFDGIEHVLGPTRTDLPSLLVQQYYADPELTRQSPLADLADLTLSDDGRYALVRVFPSATLPPNRLDRLADELRAVAHELEVDALVGGEIVEDAEWAQALYGDVHISLLIVIAGTFLALGFAFGSVVIPLKAVLMNSFTIGVAYGIVVLIFQHGWGIEFFGLEHGIGFIDSVVPLLLFTLVFGLSMDYEVFIMSRLREAHDLGRTDSQAVRYAIGATGSIITSASLVMFTVYAMFALSDVVLIKILSVGLLVGVILDATIVRLTLVPAVLASAGRWNWWNPFPAVELPTAGDTASRK